MPSECKPPSLTPSVLSKLITPTKTKSQTLLSTINNNLKSPTPPRTDPHILTIIQKQLSQSTSSIADFRSAGREDLVAKEQSQVDILSQYASTVEVVTPEVVQKAIEDAVTMLKDKGEKVAMGAVMREVSRVLEQTEKAWSKAEVAVMVKRTVEGKK